MDNKNNKKGSVLVFALIVLSFILMTAFSLATVSMIERRTSGVSVNSATAFQNSDEGMEAFLQQLYKQLDQTDTLNDLASELGSGYSCVEPFGSGPARIGSQDTDFIITAYKEYSTSSPTTLGGWDQTIAITDCDEALANVSRFRATGNYNNASRAVFLKLRDSLTRGLVAHWSFEDRAQNASLAVNGGDNVYNSFIAGDSSKNDYMLTLCDVYDSDNPANIEIDDGDATTNNPYIVSFTGCASYADSNKYMSPFKYESSCDNSDGNYNKKCSDEGAWRPGIVQENDTTSSSAIGEEELASTEALYFDGTDYLTALIDNEKCWESGAGTRDCSRTVNYVDNTDGEKLDLTDGIAISAWVKVDNTSGIKTIVSKWYNDDGYKLWIDDDEVCFAMDNKEFCSNGSNKINNSEWAHIVAVWKYDDSNPSNSAVYVYINGEAVISDNFADKIGVPNDDIPLSIGVQLKDDGSRNISPVASTYFKGAIDDVRIWKRALTGEEINRLCVDAFDQNTSPTGAPTCHDPDDSHSY